METDLATQLHRAWDDLIDQQLFDGLTIPFGDEVDGGSARVHE